jgi:hypothetical protein
MEASRMVSLAAGAPQAGDRAFGATPQLAEQATHTVLPLPLLNKQQLARHYGFTGRWVEYQLAKGMPSRMIGGRRRFELGVVDRWLHATYGGR